MPSNPSLLSGRDSRKVSRARGCLSSSLMSLMRASLRNSQAPRHARMPSERSCATAAELSSSCRLVEREQSRAYADSLSDTASADEAEDVNVVDEVVATPDADRGRPSVFRDVKSSPSVTARTRVTLVAWSRYTEREERLAAEDRDVL